MNSRTDSQLLREYAERRSEAAFAELVRRHVDLVYSAARRMVGDSHLAEDVTQGAFVALARSAPQLTGRAVLSGWLHRTTQNIAAQTVRTDVRRRAREQEAAAMNELLAHESDAAWEHIAPHLDAALGELSEADRDALMLRYFERKSAREMAQTLGISDEAAQKRVNRAVERVREFFAKRGVTVGASGLVVVISANAVQAAPVGLAVTISTAAALAGTTIVTTAAATATEAIAMTTLQKTLITAALVAAVGTGIYEARQASAARETADTLRRQQAVLNGQIEQLTRERDEATRRLAVSPADTERLIRTTDELLKLRSEVTRLRASVNPARNDPTEVAMKSWLNRVNSLKQRLAQSPEAGIPELQLLGETDWLSVVKDRSLENDADYRKAFSALRAAGEHRLVPMLQGALKKFAKANDSQFPTDLSQLKPYFETPAVDDAMLQRYEIVSQDSIGDVGVGADWVITQKAAVDHEHDNKLVIGSYGYGSTTFTPRIAIDDDQQEPLLHALVPAALAFQKANPGRESKDVSDLAPYVKTPAQQSALQAIHEATEAFKQANNGQSPKGFPELKPYLKSEAKRGR